MSAWSADQHENRRGRRYDFFMSLSSETFAGSTLRIHVVRCRAHRGACGPFEHSAVDGMVLPLRGVFVKHGWRDERIVADPCHALYFKAGEPYRVSHPVEGGDECLFLEPGCEFADRVSAWPAAKVLDPAALLERKLLAHRLEQGLASPLEAEERALQLLGVMTPEPSPPATLRERSRRAEIVEATRIALAREPGRSWKLGELARQASCSPFYLARSFTAAVGMPLHRYELRSRLAAALDHVLDTSEELTTVALDHGFSSHSHFTHAFREAFGVTPSALRRRRGRTRS
jgi:AraC-like DNA-binding protein